MKSSIRIFSATAAMIATASPVWAASTNTVYNSGILVLAFLGVCALIVTSQLIPAILVLAGMIKEMIRGARSSEAVTESAKK